jgi:hypothetical protein
VWGKAAIVKAIEADRARAAILCVLTVGLATSLALNLPGQMSYDSIMQLWQGRVGLYNSWHPPVMAWLLGLGDSVAPGSALFVVFDALLLYGGMALIVLARPRASWWALPVALVWTASPQGLIYPGIVWKDVLFAGASLLGFAALVHADLRWTRPRARFGWLAAAVLCWSLAGLTRQNGVVVPLFGAIGVGLVALRRSPALAAGRPALGALLACGAVMTLASMALAARSDGEPAARYQLEDLQVYDMTAAVAADRSLRLDLLERESPALSRVIRTKAVAVYSPQRIDALQTLTELQDAVSSTPEQVIGAQWRQLILRHPLLYLRARFASFGWTLLTPELDQCLPVFVGVDGPQPWLGRLGLVVHTRPQDRLLETYAERLVDTPIYSHLFYALLAAGLLARLLVRREPGDLAVAAMLGSALAFTATFFIISLSCDYRYLYDLDVGAIGAALYLALDLGRRRSAVLA